jgi:sugar lactone lactonase YvrE
MVESGENALDGYKVTLYASYAGRRPYWRALGATTTDGTGEFSIRLKRGWQRAILFVVAEKDSAMLASAIGRGPRIPRYVVVNELTTVATGTSFAQFIDGQKIRGNTYGMLNAVEIAEDMANPETGELGAVLANSPNGSGSSTLKTFNTLANIVGGCIADVEDGGNCEALLGLAEAPDGACATTVLDAVANMTKNPSNAVEGLFRLGQLSGSYDPPYTPALTEAPASWLLFIKFTGGFYSDYAFTNLINGPGQVAIDKRGYFWINDNYVPVNPFQGGFNLTDFLSNPPAVLPDYIACAGKRLLKFYPWGEPYAGMPITTGYTGGGLSGAGFGITLDPRGNVWVGNFGFEAPICADFPAIAAPHDSVSLFHPNGKPISGPNGFIQGQIWWPQATMSDRKGNIWIANCGNDTVTMIPRGNPWRANNIPLPGGLGEAGYYKPVYEENDSNTHPRLKPFGLTMDPKGRAWVTGNLAPGNPDTGIGAVYRISPDGTVENIPNTPTDGARPLFSRPMGIVGDSKGNIWVPNSDAVNVPCVDPFKRHAGGNPSVAFISADGSTRQVYTGGGLTIPWGSAIDGDDQLWVFNFNEHLNADADGFEYPPTALSRFCGTGKCPARKSLGDPISPNPGEGTSPDGGYTTDMLDRVTGGAIGPSGAIVILNNWQKPGPRPIYYNTSPGGNSFVIVPGAAAPIKTPLIGPPQSFSEPYHHAGSRFPAPW